MSGRVKPDWTDVYTTLKSKVIEKLSDTLDKLPKDENGYFVNFKGHMVITLTDSFSGESFNEAVLGFGKEMKTVTQYEEDTRTRTYDELDLDQLVFFLDEFNEIANETDKLELLKLETFIKAIKEL